MSYTLRKAKKELISDGGSIIEKGEEYLDKGFGSKKKVRK